MIVKAGDSLTLRGTTTGAGAAGVAPYTYRYDFTSGTYLGQAAIVGTLTVNGTTVASSGQAPVIYLDPVTGGQIGASNATGNATDSVTTYEPADWQQRLTAAGIQGGSSGKINVTSTTTGRSVTDGFAALGGATAIVIKYEFLINRDANETVITPAGSFSNSCKFRVEFKLLDFAIQGPASSNPTLAFVLPSLQAAFAVPTKITMWTTSAVPLQLPKSITELTVTGSGTTTTTIELINLVKAPR